MNEKLKFRLPTAEDAAEYISYRQAFLDAGSSMDGTGPMRRTPDPMEWLAINAQYADPATVPEGKVQSMQFVCERVSDGRIVGMLQVRLALNTTAGISATRCARTSGGAAMPRGCSRRDWITAARWDSEKCSSPASIRTRRAAGRSCTRAAYTRAPSTSRTRMKIWSVTGSR